MYSLLLHTAEGTTKKNIVRWRVFCFVARIFRVDDSHVCFLTKIPSIQILCPKIPHTNVVERYKDCSPSSSKNLQDICNLFSKLEGILLVRPMWKYI